MSSVTANWYFSPTQTASLSIFTRCTSTMRTWSHAAETLRFQAAISRAMR